MHANNLQFDIYKWAIACIQRLYRRTESAYVQIISSHTDRTTHCYNCEYDIEGVAIISRFDTTIELKLS